MKINLISIFLFFLFTSCQFKVTSPEEDKVISSLEDKFDGEIGVRKGVKIDGSNISENYINLTFYDNGAIRNKDEVIPIISSNIAYIFNNASGIKNKYSIINVNIDVEGAQYGYTYNQENLKEFDFYKKKYDSVSYFLINKNYQKIIASFDEDLLKTSEIQNFINSLSIYDSINGPIQDSEIMGFDYLTETYKKDSLIYITGVLKRKEAIPLNLVFDRKTNKLVNLNFDKFHSDN